MWTGTLAVALIFVSSIEARASSSAATSSRSGVRVVIIGAGAAGLSAAQRLNELGFRHVTILEAQNRTGGRVFSQDRENNAFVELGAEQVHGSGQPFYDFAHGKGLLVPMPTGLDDFRTDTGKQLETSEKWSFDNAVTTFSQITRSMSDKSTLTSDMLRHVSVETNRGSQFRRRHHLSELNSTLPEAVSLAYDYSIRLEIIETSCPAPMKLLSHRYYTDFKQHGDNFLVHPNTSYTSLLREMTMTFPPSWIELNRAVSRISLTTPGQSSSPIMVEAADGTMWPADHVIVTVSLGVLKSCPSLFDPPLPMKKREAISKSGFGNVAKLFLTFPLPVWKDLFPNGSRLLGLLWTNNSRGIPYNPPKVNQTMFWYRDAVHFAPVPTAPNTLLLWVTGVGADLVDGLSDEQVLDDSWALLKNFTANSTVPRPVKLTRETWSANPFARGTYSYFSLESSKANFTPADLAEPEWNYETTSNGGILGHRLLFAGEATEPDFFSTVHGAVLSGQREANRIELCANECKERYWKPAVGWLNDIKL
ncbi:putative Peroxisomal N(1)-acetyl-spermine/spermidine oxidase [Hypsibius exemplaris]|uniref:Peroxisomal N(1)-acetyl-spermine/spermidine oxidase n=1 Tax=Hypsibius exemplaris TaxID=2072580 RepID=A0A9X6RL38_HYPEX|nr:putative Peroxisomal N(1)-acetyl-spermine/spermidine oxidase [Hypsibius exemplaris]